MVPWYKRHSWNDITCQQWRVKMGEQQLVGLPTKSLREFLQFEPNTAEELEAMDNDRLFMITILKSIEPKTSSVSVTFNPRKKFKNSTGFPSA